MITPGKHLGDLSACWPLVNVQNPLQLQRTHCFSVIWKGFAFAFSTTKITHTNNREKNLLFRDILENITRMNKKIWHKNKIPSAHLAPKLQEFLNFHKNQYHCNPWYTGIQRGIFFFGLFLHKLSVQGNKTNLVTYLKQKQHALEELFLFFFFQLAIYLWDFFIKSNINQVDVSQSYNQEWFQ